MSVACSCPCCPCILCATAQHPAQGAPAAPCMPTAPPTACHIGPWPSKPPSPQHSAAWQVLSTATALANKPSQGMWTFLRPALATHVWVYTHKVCSRLAAATSRPLVCTIPYYTGHTQPGAGCHRTPPHPLLIPGWCHLCHTSGSLGHTPLLLVQHCCTPPCCTHACCTAVPPNSPRSCSSFMPPLHCSTTLSQPCAPPCCAAVWL